ncbi:MAG: LysM peptidoglycan-binding domain-containing protein [Candidatus Moraniibacteriota bacterium]
MKNMKAVIALFILLSVWCGVRVAEAIPKTATTTYVVKQGDQLLRLFGRDCHKVAVLNKINPDKIKPGQILFVPPGVYLRVGTSKTRITSGFVRKEIKGDLIWKSGADKLSLKPRKGPMALRTVVKDLDRSASVVLWNQLRNAPVNGRFVTDDSGRLVAWVNDSTRLSMADGYMIGGRKIIRYHGDLKPKTPLKNDALTAMKISDQWVVMPAICGNISLGRMLARQLEKMVETKETVIEDLQPISAIPQENVGNELLKWELIAGAGLYSNNLAHGNWQYAEGDVLIPLGDGYAVGGGFYGMWGDGESKTSSYTWHERSGIGPQVVLRRDYLKEQTDEFGQTVELPAAWGIKARYLPNDYVTGGNGVYNMSQTGKKFGLYAEVYERKSEDWLFGFTGEYWKYFDGKIRSTWSGDTPQNRSSWNVNAIAQYSFDEDWALRGILGVSHQYWDRLNYLNLTPEVRYQNWLMFGPRVSIPLNKPDEFYRDVTRGDLFTIGAFVRAEFGGVLRAKDCEDRRASVVKLGTIDEVTDEQLKSGTENDAPAVLPEVKHEDSLPAVPAVSETERQAPAGTENDEPFDASSALNVK